MKTILKKIAILLAMIGISFIGDMVLNNGHLHKEDALVSVAGSMLVYIAIVFYADFKTESSAAKKAS
ncbi:MAG: hypothetical protein FGM61_08050 [Sediminibacterium sp.]|nr:hypothetical protein [Sediminibacterium sp.]